MAGSLSPTTCAGSPLGCRSSASPSAGGPGELDSVGVDNFEGMRAATRHLLEPRLRERRVRRRPLAVGRRARPLQRLPARARSTRGLVAPDAPAVRGDFTEKGGDRAVEQLLRERERPPRALVVGNDQMAVGGDRRARSARLPRPRRRRAHRLRRHPARAARPSDADDGAAAAPPDRRGMRASAAAAHRPMPTPSGRRSSCPTALVVRESCGCTEAVDG